MDGMNTRCSASIQVPESLSKECKVCSQHANVQTSVTLGAVVLLCWNFHASYSAIYGKTKHSTFKCMYNTKNNFLHTFKTILVTVVKTKLN